MKNIRYIKITLVVLISLTFVMPFNVIKAESGTYFEASANECVQVGYYSYFNDTANTNVRYTANVQNRSVLFQYNNVYHLYIVSLSSGLGYINFDSNTACSVPSSSLRSQTYNNNTFYFKEDTVTISSSTYEFIVSGSVPVVIYDISNLSYNQKAEYAYRYTYGDLAVEGTNEPDYGSLKTGYNTDFVSSGFTQDRYNKDIITWDNYDTNGNYLDNTDYFIEIRAIPGYYTAPSQIDLLNQTVSNWIRGVVVSVTNGAVNLEPVEYYTLWRGSPSVKKFEILWGDVVDAFYINRNEDSLKAFVQDEIWYKSGWRYEIRYIKGTFDDPEYESDWQVIYQVTSVDPDDSETILNTYPNGLSPDLYNLLQTVNTLNNTVQNWNINGVPINMQPNQQVQPDNSWVEILISGILEAVGNIVEAIGNLISAIAGLGSDLIEALFNLITSVGVNIVDFFTRIWNDLLGLIDDIDLTLFEWYPDDEATESYNFVQPIIDAFIDTGLIYMLMIPFIVLVVRVFL